MRPEEYLTHHRRREYFRTSSVRKQTTYPQQTLHFCLKKVEWVLDKTWTVFTTSYEVLETVCSFLQKGCSTLMLYVINTFFAFFSKGLPLAMAGLKDFGKYFIKAVQKFFLFPVFCLRSKKHIKKMFYTHKSTIKNFLLSIVNTSRSVVTGTTFLLIVLALQATFLMTLMDTLADGETAPLAAKEEPQILTSEDFLTMAELLPSSFIHHEPMPRLEPAKIFRSESSTPAQELPLAHSLHSFNSAAIVPVSTAPGSVRIPFCKTVVQMTADLSAIHPLDRSGLLKQKFKQKYLTHVLATVDNPALPALPHHTSIRPATAIIPHIDRLDQAEFALARNRALGKLSALFESGMGGIYAVGYDPHGGTSYGKYQLASRAGAVDVFIAYLEKRAPQIALRLKKAKPANTRGMRGAMPKVWKEIARENPKLFEQLQDDFVLSNYYRRSYSLLQKRIDLDLDSHPPVVKEVLWSTAVQHGPYGGASIFIRASKKAQRKKKKDFATALIQEVFTERSKYAANMGGNIRKAFLGRIKSEQQVALHRLEKQNRAKELTLLAKKTDFM